MKRAIITGITGQDGAYLAELLLSKNYEVHGIQRRTSLSALERIEHLLNNSKLMLHYADMTDSSSIIRLISEIQPDEIYHLAAQSHVQVSFDTPEYTANVDALGTLRILEAIRILRLTEKTKFLQASTSELYGNTAQVPQSETTPFSPCSPYATAKLYAYWVTINYRQAYNIFASNGIFFNHESPLRGETFVSRKITRAVARISYGVQNMLYLGNLDAKRDWGYAKDYVDAMWLILQHKNPDDFVIATGQQYSVRDFVSTAFKEIGITIFWHGTGIDEKGIDEATGKVLVQVSPALFRPTEVNCLLGDARKARYLLNWQPTVNFHELVHCMVSHDLALVQKELLLKQQGRGATTALR